MENVKQKGRLREWIKKSLEKNIRYFLTQIALFSNDRQNGIVASPAIENVKDKCCAIEAFKFHNGFKPNLFCKRNRETSTAWKNTSLKFSSMLYKNSMKTSHYLGT